MTAVPDVRVGASLPDESALLHVTGAAEFVDDMREPMGTLHAALALSPVAHGRLRPIDLDAIRVLPGVVDVLSAADIPGENDCGTIVHDEPVLAADEVTYAGQPVLAVVATTHAAALRAAQSASALLQADRLPMQLDHRRAHADGEHVIAPMLLARSTAGADIGEVIASAPHRLQGTFDCGGQEHTYLEGQVAFAVPLDDGAVLVHSSTQHPTEVQKLVARTLGLGANRVRVLCRRMGGGFGGKESQAAQYACVAAIAARRLGRPVKLRLDRHTDDLATGKRHAFWFEYDVGYDDDGRIIGYDLVLVSQAGHSADLSGPVLTRAMCHVDNAYWLPDVRMRGFAARTNIQSSTAFRGFGGPQGALVTEYVLDSIARRLGLEPLDVRRANFYAAADGDPRSVTPYGEPVEDNVVHELVAELERSSEYQARRRQVADYNAGSEVLKRGIALTPVKFGISFNVTQFNQAGALVHVYVDGSVLVNHSATEMGQGVNTKVRQVVADELGIPLDWVRSTATDTEKVANTSATAASTGSDMNGKAAQAAARRIRGRLMPVAARLLDAPPEDIRFGDGQVAAAGRTVPLPAVLTAAYAERIQLWSDGFYATPGLSWDGVSMQGRPFHYYCYGAAVSEVVIDTLTGESRVLRSDLLHDVGRSLNPAVDIGQVEGAFVQGMGWLTQEELRWDADGRLVTLAPTTYKAPTAHDVPADLRTRLFENPLEPDTIHGSKAVGEPPLLLSFSVFFAIRDAISSVADHLVDPPLRAPATAEEILRTIDAVRSTG